VTINALNRSRLRASAARPSSGEEPAGRASAALGGVGVTQALDELGCDEREALLLVGLEELEYAEACEILNIPRPTLVSRLARARRAMAERIDPRQAQERGRRPQPPHLRVVK
jgi:RNA polymerase sigma-70 factor (ECF subfamily)